MENNIRPFISSLALFLIVLLILYNPSYSESKEYGKPGRLTLEGENLPPAASINATATAGNTPFAVQFTGNGSDADGSIVSYHWDFGDGIISDQQNPIHTYQAGIYTTVLTVTDNLGATGTDNVTITSVLTTWMRKDMLIELGEGWVESGSPPCIYARGDGGITIITLPNAPNGIFDLWLWTYFTDVSPRFLLDGEFFDFISDEISGYQWIRVKTIHITERRYTFSIDDLPDGGITVRGLKLEVPKSQSSAVVISAIPTQGEIPLTVQFTTESAEPGSSIVDYFWYFGDGSAFNQQNPSHTYSAVGRYTTTLMAKDISGAIKIANVSITATPQKENLKGLKDVEAFGFWAAGFKLSPDYGQPSPSENALYNQRRMDELSALHVNFVIPNVYWSQWNEKYPSYHQFLEDLRAQGIKVAVTPGVGGGSWYTNDAPGNPKSQWVFDPSEAEAKLQATDLDGDGISDLDSLVGAFYLGHEIYEYATYEERVQMYQVVKRYFPNTPAMPYYGSAFDYPFVMADQPHPRGGTWKDYQFGSGETDIICFFVSPPFTYDAEGNRHFDPRQTIESLLKQKQYADAIAPEIPIWVGTTIGSDSDPSVMWQPEEILDWARAILSVGDIQGIFARGYGRLKYDLGYGTNTAAPSQPETGFIEQRQAFKTVGEWIQQAK